MRHRRRQAPLAALAAVSALIGLAIPGTAIAAAPSSAGSGHIATAPTTKTAPMAAAAQLHTAVGNPDATLAPGWKTSGDRAVTVSGDQNGLHILTANSSAAYQWNDVTTLSEPGFSTDMWIGNFCLTDPSHAMVVYAPREFTNTGQLMEQGGFAAVVDLDNGKTTKLDFTASLAYFDPSCNTSTHTAVFTAINDQAGKTRLITVNDTGKDTATTVTSGEVTSAVPTSSGIVAASGSELVQVNSNGTTRNLAATSGSAFSLHTDAHGGVLFADLKGSTESIKRWSGAKATTLATGASGQVGIQSGQSGNVFLTGTPKTTSTLPAGVTRLKVPVTSTVSTTGALAVDTATSVNLPGQVANPLQTVTAGAQPPVTITASVAATGKSVDFSVPTASGSTSDLASPALTSAGSGTAATSGSGKTPALVKAQTVGSPTSTIDDDRTCAISRNDPTQQAYQPTPNQVEWAVDMAIRGDLTSSWVNQGDWRTTDGLGTVNPQGMFPLPSLTGGGRIPAQILLGILSQESNLWQAEEGALPGQTSSPLTGNYYGNPIVSGTPPTDPEAVWEINWATSDCGYGIGQVTDGMRVGQTSLTAAQQKAIALDYTSNIAESASILAQKWNELQTTTPPLTINNNSASKLEDWFAAVWDYNEGFNAPTGAGEPWGLGWLNNPANPIYPPTRGPFLDGNISCTNGSTAATGYTNCATNTSLTDGPSYADAAQPQNWPYEEKVIGWAMAPIDTGRSYDDNGNLNSGNTAGYSPAWWNSDYDRVNAKPPIATFCNTSNDCNISSPPPCETQKIQGCDQQHWFDQPATWKTDCATSCGNEYLTYQTLRVEPGNGKTSTPDCSTSDLPSNALIIDSVSGQVPPMVDGCSKTWSDAGTLSFTFDADSAGDYEGKEDFHQIGGGFGGHFWYASTRSVNTGVDNIAADDGDPTVSTMRQVLAAPSVSGPMAVSGSWKLSNRLNAWTRVMVHVPDTGASTQEAIYTIHMGNGSTENRIINTHYKANTWVSLGVFDFVPGSDFQGVTLTNYAYDGSADSTVAWDAMAFSPLPAKPADFVVQLGDSYSSGVGIGNFLTNTATGPYAVQSKIPADQGYNDCLRSQYSWIRQTVLPDNVAAIGTRSDDFDPTLDFHSVACNGAVTSDADPALPGSSGGTMKLGGDGEFGEVPQLYSGDLDANTTLVAMTFGGNDAGFASTLTSCAEFGCPTTAAVEAKIQTAVQNVSNLIGAVHAIAPNARIALLGYPTLFDTSNLACESIMLPSMSMSTIDGWSAYMTQEEQAVAASTGATWVPPNFSGAEDCDSPSGINDYIAGPSSDDPSDNSCPLVNTTWTAIQKTVLCASVQSFHPTLLGAQIYASALTNALLTPGGPVT